MKMRWLLLLASLAIAARGWSGEMKPSEPKMKEMLQEVVQKQLAAFRQDDFAAAYVFADDGIKAQFPLEAFEKMVKAGYPLIAKSVAVTFGLIFDDGEEAAVQVRIEGEKKKTGTFQYHLKRAGETWRILGVTESQPEGIEV